MPHGILHKIITASKTKTACVHMKRFLVSGNLQLTFNLPGSILFSVFSKGLFIVSLQDCPKLSSFLSALSGNSPLPPPLQMIHKCCELLTPFLNLCLHCMCSWLLCTVLTDSSWLAGHNLKIVINEM